MNKLNKTKSAVSYIFRFSVFLQDPFFFSDYLYEPSLVHHLKTKYLRNRWYSVVIMISVKSNWYIIRYSKILQFRL